MKSLMVIMERYLAEIGTQLRIGGIVSKEVVHFQGVPHGAVQVAVVVLKEINGYKQPHILLHKRSKWKKISPNKWDICGGHVIADQRIIPAGEITTLPMTWEDQSLIKNLFLETAIREVNEEVTILIHNFKFENEHIKSFGGIGAFDYGFHQPDSLNKEFSTFYVAFVPQTIILLKETTLIEEIVEVKDSIGVEGQEQEEEASELKVITLILQR